MDCPSSDPIDPRVRRTRKLLQDSLQSLLSEKAFPAISVQDIAERATVNRATFYAHYASKEALTAALFQEHLHAAMVRRFPAMPTLTHGSLVEFAVAVFEYMGSMHDRCPDAAANLQGTVQVTIQQVLYEHMEIWLSMSPGYKRLFPDCEIGTTATVLSCSIFGGAYRWSVSPNRRAAAKVCGEIVSILLPRCEFSPNGNGALPV